jgi:hypothetical protein
MLILPTSRLSRWAGPVVLEHVLFEPTRNDVALTGTDITTQTVIATATISPFTS